jgi:uncharacterized NAD(P)/FAD-binding protein YdhS
MSQTNEPIVTQNEREAIPILLTNENVDGFLTSSKTELLLKIAQGINRPIIAIIGGGPAGIATLYQLSKRATELGGSEIILFERNRPLGAGTPHRSENPALRLNMRTELHAVDPEEPNGFVNWLAFVGYEGELPPPRHYFGKYLEVVAEDARLRLIGSGCPVHFIFDEAAQITNQGAGYLIGTTFGYWCYADCVVLALGHEAPGLLKQHVGVGQQQVQEAA